MYKLCLKTSFSAAHHLKETPSLKTKKCQRIHGHNYDVFVEIETKELKDDMVIDYGEIKESINWLDHKDLNEFFDNPTTEKICEYILMRLALLMEGRNLSCRIKVTVKESPNSSITCDYENKNQ